MNKIGFQKLIPTAIVPTKAHPTDAGYDLYSCCYKRLNSMERAVVSTGICVEIPEGFYGRVAPRSGLAVKNGIDVLAGVIDSGYRGEVGVVLINLAAQPFITQQDITFEPSSSFDIHPGDRIAQLIIERHYNAEWEERDVLKKETERSQGGFGSTGL